MARHELGQIEVPVSTKRDIPFSAAIAGGAMGARGFDHCAFPDLIYFASAAELLAHEIVLGRVLWTVGVAGAARTSREKFGGAGPDAGTAASAALRPGDVSAFNLRVLGMV